MNTKRKAVKEPKLTNAVVNESPKAPPVKRTPSGVVIPAVETHDSPTPTGKVNSD